MKSVHDIDFSPKPGKKYWVNCHREWREEFIYFLLVDRFHDSAKRLSLNFEDRHPGFDYNHQLQQSLDGTIRGIIDHIEYIKNLGCTAIWLSPVFENNPESYHGYAIQNYLEVDKRWGTREDLEQLVDLAHVYDMRVFLDIVLHHSGDNWFYPGNYEYNYFNGIQFPFGGWRYEDKPVPVELRNPDLYNREGQIRNFDNYPETRKGDFCKLKAFRNDESSASEYVQDILAAIHCYWIQETDIDGFRLDAVKHMDEGNISRFCSVVREYAYSLGKKNFFLFGELIGNDAISNKYIGPKTPVSGHDQNIYYGLNSVFDHPLYVVLAEVIKGKASPGKLIERYTALQKNAVNRGEYGEFLVTYIDNHDQVGSEFKHRFGYDATPEQVVAGIGFLLCALGTPCIYYGTEQGFEGCGKGDWYIREAMFDQDDKSTNVLNQHSYIYTQIALIAQLRKKEAALKFGRMYIRKTSADGLNFHFPNCAECVLAFSRILFNEEILVVYNSALAEAKEEYILIDATINKERKYMKCIFGRNCEIEIQSNNGKDDGCRFIKLYLKPMQFVILKNS